VKMILIFSVLPRHNIRQLVTYYYLKLTTLHK